MKIINTRSPYFIDVTGTNTTSVQLYIWNGNTEPASPNYTFTKPSPSATQTTSNYNITPYIDEFIDNVAPSYSATPSAEVSTSFCQFKAIKFSDGVNRTLAFQTRVNADGGTFENINCVGDLMQDFIIGCAVGGFNDYMGGYNQADNVDVLPLTSTAISYNYQENTDKTYFNLIVNHTGKQIDAVYLHNNVTYTSNILNSSVSSGVYNFKIPFKQSGFTQSNTISIKQNGTTLYSFNVAPICEPKYTPVLCSFINRYGGWAFLTFYKAKTNSISISSEQAKFLSETPNYTPTRGQFQSFNINGQKSVSLNTGWISESYNELIEDLLVSKKILLDNVPVQIKTNSTELKSNLQNKNINYTIEFTYSFDFINSVI